jgi:hypothetical protein
MRKLMMVLASILLPTFALFGQTPPPLQFSGDVSQAIVTSAIQVTTESNDPCPLTSISVQFTRTGVMPNTCSDYGIYGGNSFIDTVIRFSVTPQAGRTLGVTLHTASVQPLILVWDDLNNFVGNYAKVEPWLVNDAGLVIPATTGRRYVVEIGVPADQVGTSYTVNITAALPPPLMDHQMATTIEVNSPWDPIAPTHTFLPTDLIAWEWVKVGPIVGVHMIEFTYYSPNGYGFYSDQSFTVGDSHAWGWYKTEGGIYISGYQAANLLGNWRVEVRIDGVLATTDRFTIQTPPPSPIFPVHLPRPAPVGGR